MDLREKTALVTGSARGLGKKAVQALAAKGCKVVINYVHSEREAHELAEEIRKSGGTAVALQADITEPKQREQLMEEAASHFGGVDILVNNAGPFIRERIDFADYKPEQIEHLLEGNLIAPMALDHLALPWMRKRGWGRIIHFGFAHAGEARGWPHRSVYAAAKVGLASFTKTLAMEEAEHGITVNMICPGDIRGENKERDIADVTGLIDAESPRGRPGSGEDVARVIAFLCEPASDYITGSIIEVSGALDPIRPLPLERKKK